ncbi:MAG: M48 family metallopeptidase [Synergistaceae bacterium]|nr:M48 family metallopeptidase [Synergistaceae bacterium]
MNIYDHIDANNRRTVAILLAFPAALFVLVILGSYLVIQTGILTYARMGVSYFTLISKASIDTLQNSNLEHLMFGEPGSEPGVSGQTIQLTMTVFPWMILVALPWIAFSYCKGSAMILRMANARAVTFEENRELFRLVENTAVMAGLPTPKIYFIADDSMNAFATGREPEIASIALTKGIVEKLDKDELQAVIAHELAHIGNRDTRLMMLTVAGIGCFTFFGEMILHGGKKGRKINMRISILFVIGHICLIFGCVVAPILRLALSRLREYQADATAAIITRNPDALARALYKISKNPQVEAFDSSSLFGNICIVDPTKKRSFSFMSKLYATHPPIEDRIAVLRKMAVSGKE